MNDLAIASTELVREFGRLRALDNLTIKVHKGRILALLGPNGAGKTTFLKLLMGLIEPTSGQVEVLGVPCRKQTAQVARRIAGMGEGHEPPHWATLKTLRRIQSGVSSKFDGSFFERFCAEKKLSLSKLYGTLSKGQKRWVLAGLTFAAGAEVILMDEPADGLDPSARRGLYDHLRDYVSRTQATVVVATHIINDIERVADQVAIIDAGKLILHASLEDLREQVRQVELPNCSVLPQFGESVALLGSVQQGDTLLVWLKTDGSSDEQLKQRLTPEATIRPTNLETLYLAVAEHRLPDGQDSKTEKH